MSYYSHTQVYISIDLPYSWALYREYWAMHQSGWHSNTPSASHSFSRHHQNSSLALPLLTANGAPLYSTQLAKSLAIGWYCSSSWLEGSMTSVGHSVALSLSCRCGNNIYWGMKWRSARCSVYWHDHNGGAVRIMQPVAPRCSGNVCRRIRKGFSFSG